VSLSGRTRAWWERRGAGAIDLSMTHSRELAAAIAVVSAS
jgi:phosphopantetheinyl transferase (holo-ACP synthase)